MDALPSDTEAALAMLTSQCPPGARLLDGAASVAPLHALYTVVHEPTEVDQEVERLRLANQLRILRLHTPYGEEHLVLDAHEYATAMAACVEGRAVASALEQCTGIVVRAQELSDALPVRAGCNKHLDAFYGRLVRAGWLVPMRQMSSAGPEEAPLLEDGAWLWSCRGAGRLAFALHKCREQVLRVLWKQKFHRALRQVVERTPAVQKVLAEGQLDFRFVLRDCMGKRLLKEGQPGAGAQMLELTPAGQQAAHANQGRKRRR